MARDDEKPRDSLERRYGPLQEAIGKPEMNAYIWKRETGDVQHYKHKETGGYLHVDSQGQFYDRFVYPIERREAMENARNPELAAQRLELREVKPVANTIEKTQPQEYALGM